jgi:DNA-binding transcriptional regulator YhcF (GntR family)
METSPRDFVPELVKSQGNFKIHCGAITLVPMKIWISKNSAVPIQEQLSTQLILGIVSGDLASGEKLQSAPEIARRFHIHANTVRAAYRILVKRGWAEWRRGSGYYVRRRPSKVIEESAGLDRIVADFVEAARRSGYSLDQIRTRVLRWGSLAPPDHVLVVEPDSELRAILIAELNQGIPLRVEGAGLDQLSSSELLGAFCVTLPGQVDKVRQRLPLEIPLLTLKPRSVARSIAGQPRPPEDVPITVISRWPDFLKWAHSTLTGVGLDPAAFDLRDARRKDWKRSLSGRSFIISDSVVALQLPAGTKPHVFQIISEESIAELRDRLAV